MDTLLQQRHEELLAQYELLRQKIGDLRKDQVYAGDVDSRYHLDKAIEQSEKKREELYQQIDEIERQLKAVNRGVVDVEANVKNNENFFEIIGFDLGHGETAIASTTSRSLSDPQSIDILNNKNSILTAVAFDPKKGILIGDDAYIYPKSESLRILFKGSRFDNPEVSESIKLFVYKCLQILQNAGKIANNENSYFFVGSPAGWFQEDRDSYKRILKKAGMQNVVIVPESRAAFLDAKESGALNETQDRLFNSVLIIDIGSSTTDFTIIKNYEEKPLDFGYNSLGAGLIDIAIFHKTLTKLGGRKSEIEKLFDDNPVIKAKCLLKCREVKENYFSKSNELDWIEMPCSASERILDKGHFDIDIYKSDMEEILSTNIPELENNWPDAFRAALIKCKESKEYQYPKLVLLTGGGSRMRFTYDICREIFSDSIVKVGLEPHLTIAKGLAIVGRTDFKIQGFRTEIEELIHSDKLQGVVVSEFPGLFRRVSATFLKHCIRISLKDFERWANGEFKTLVDMEKNSMDEINTLIKDQGEKIFTGDIVQWLTELNPKIETLTHAICDKYNVPRKALSASVTPSAVEIDQHKFTDVVKLGDSATTTFGIVTGGLATTITLILTLFLTELISSILLAVLVALTGGVLAVVIGIIVGIGLKDIIDQKITENFKDADIPIGWRNFLFSEKKFTEKIDEKRAELEKGLVQIIEKEFSSRDKLGEFLDAIRQDLNRRADEACVLIR
ncbi:MAG: hypothetical protein CNIPEHKO_03049 [Anaerolineales bacterium]|nr:hypothetical protein [Anaerolineales bacterium]